VIRMMAKEITTILTIIGKKKVVRIVLTTAFWKLASKAVRDAVRNYLAREDLREIQRTTRRHGRW